MATTLSRQGGFLKYSNTSTGKIVYFDFNDITVNSISGNKVFLNNGNSYDYTVLDSPIVSSAEELSDQIGTWKTEAIGGGLNFENIQFIYSNEDLPAPNLGIITLDAHKTYYFASDVDLNGNRLVGGQDTTILGTSSENASITSTGLGVGVALFTTEWTTQIRNITFKDVDTAINIDGNTNSPLALDWTGVNFQNIPNIGQINTCDNFIYTKGAFLNSKGLNFTGNHGTIAFNQSLFSGDGFSGSLISLDASCVVSRRFRIIYSSFIAFGSTIGLDVSTSATIPTESYILDTINFSGGGTYTTGIDYLDNKVRWDGNKGIVNTSEFANYYMTNNATITPILVSGTAYKILGATTANVINQKFSHTDNRATYTGEIIRDFEVTAIVSFTTGNNKVIGLYVAKNGVIIPESEMYATASGSGRAESISVQTIVQLNQNDYIELFVENETDTSNITVEYLNLTISSLN
jgi:hypothetical protein